MITTHLSRFQHTMGPPNGQAWGNMGGKHVLLEYVVVVVVVVVAVNGDQNYFNGKT